MINLIDFKPTWIRSEIWKQMLDHLNTPKWKEKSSRNKEIRSRATGRKHTLGSQSYVTMKRKAIKIVNFPLLFYINIYIYIYIYIHIYIYIYIYVS
ncbi:putative transposase, Ptta/En/Spm, plant [Helianthus anomalus]